VFLDKTSGFWLEEFEISKSSALAITHANINYVKSKSPSAIVMLNTGFFDSELLTNYDTTVKAVISDLSISTWIPAAGASCARRVDTGETFGPGPFCTIDPTEDGLGGLQVVNPPAGLRDYIQLGLIKSNQLVALLYGSQTLTNCAL
jgi:hypothetical protein